MKLNILLVLSMVTFLTSCNGQNANPSNNFKKSENQIVIGDTVNQLGNNIMVVFQDSKNVHWFGSWETGIYRYDGKTLINYTTKHGLKQNRIDEIKEDKYGNIYFNSCFPSSVITKFDGHQFIRLTAKTSNDWKLLDDDLWFRPTNNTDGRKKSYTGFASGGAVQTLLELCASYQVQYFEISQYRQYVNLY